MTYSTEIERDEQGRATRVVSSRVDPHFDDAPASGVTPHASTEDGLPRCVCGKPRARKGRFCSRQCKDRAYNAAHPVARQRLLLLDPPPAPLIRPRDQRTLPARRRGYSAQAKRIMDRLEQGPVSNAELALMFPPATAWRSRLSDCRWEFRRRYGLRDDQDPVPGYDCGGGLVWHWLA